MIPATGTAHTSTDPTLKKKITLVPIFINRSTLTTSLMLLLCIDVSKTGKTSSYLKHIFYYLKERLEAYIPLIIFIMGVGGGTRCVIHV